MDKKEEELLLQDDFWAIEKLVLDRKKPQIVRQNYDTSAVEVSSDPAGEAGTEGEGKGNALSVGYSPKQPEPQLPDDEYVPVSPLIGRVKIYRWKNSYNYYEEFRRDAIRFLPLKGKPCVPVSFFSYVPQYVQLTEAQLRYYLYFRDCMRRGNSPEEVDYSYVLLLIYEIINLGDAADTRKGQALLCRIWSVYREVYPRLDRYLADWICDYSLIHHLPPPVGICDRGLADNSTLKEFYVYYGEGEGESISLGYAHALMRFCSGYDYRKSKFAAGENLVLYDMHLSGALARVIETCSDGGHLLSAASLTENRITRDAYSGALCASEMKRRLEISFYSFSRSHELRFLVADILKYAENRLRGYLGIKSRLSVFGLPKPLAAAVDAYFDEKFPIRRQPKIAPSDATGEAYEKFYDAPASALSPESAAKIEAMSWETTRLLIDAFGGEGESEGGTSPKEKVLPSPKKEAPPPAKAEGNDREILHELLDADMLAFIDAVMRGDTAEEDRLAKERGLLAEAFADEINSAAADVIGDVVLEDRGEGFAVIEDYREFFEDDR